MPGGDGKSRIPLFFCSFLPSPNAACSSARRVPAVLRACGVFMPSGEREFVIAEFKFMITKHLVLSLLPMSR